MNVAHEFQQLGVFLAQDGFVPILVCQLLKICFIAIGVKIGDKYAFAFVRFDLYEIWLKPTTGIFAVRSFFTQAGRGFDEKESDPLDGHPYIPRGGWNWVVVPSYSRPKGTQERTGTLRQRGYPPGGLGL
jgi:hypothetical protein